ncbi:hypothetical protein EDD86DRAFT_207836 [Gorgonomyces haynaldii]|nr:hypothetical protein EDD86DRAFT_207836 [Gorgonomyces haynaldii]
MKVKTLTIAFGDSWADDAVELPSAPARSLQQSQAPERERSYDQPRREQRQALPIPKEPPFNAFIGNLSFEVTDRDIETLFGDIAIKSIRLVRDPQTSQPKGFGYVEFEDAQGLEQALKYDGESVMNRRIRINVAEGAKSRDREGGFRDGFKDRRREEDPKFGTNWRSTARALSPPRDGPFKSGPRRDNFEKRPSAPTWGRSENGNPFGRRDDKPKANPFGDAVPVDHSEVDRKIEERRSETERPQREIRDRPVRQREPKEKTKADLGPWRRNTEEAPGKDKFAAFGGKKKPVVKKEAPAKVDVANAYAVLDQE